MLDQLGETAFLRATLGDGQQEARIGLVVEAKKVEPEMLGEAY